MMEGAVTFTTVFGATARPLGAKWPCMAPRLDETEGRDFAGCDVNAWKPATT